MDIEGRARFHSRVVQGGSERPPPHQTTTRFSIISGTEVSGAGGPHGITSHAHSRNSARAEIIGRTSNFFRILENSNPDFKKPGDPRSF